MPAPVTLDVDEAMLAALDRLAVKTSRSRDWLIRRAMEDFLALSAWQIGKIEDGLAAAERGDFAADDEVARVQYLV